MHLYLFQKGFNFSQDGPGNRLVYHLKGCNMHCPWCSNPEGMHMDVGTSACVTPEALVAEAVSAAPMFFEQGGVTFTGGEATLQADALKKTLRGLKAQGINTAIETNGTCRDLPTLFDLIDHLIIDLKHPDSDTHQRVTGVGNETIRQNITLAAEQGRDLLVRIPLIGGFNTDTDAQNGFLAFFAGIRRETVRVELLPYHEYGKDKWNACGRPYTVENAFVSEETRRSFEAKLKETGLTVIRT